jgi:hypothetical protein
MSKEYKSIGVNTDPLSVQLYFDENNAIKWKIICKETIIQTQQEPIKSDNILINNENKVKKELVLSSVFNNIYIIGNKNKYTFNYNEISLELNDNNIEKVNEIQYQSFDYLKYNKIIDKNLSKNMAWIDYVKNIKNNNNINLDLTNIEISEINSLIDIITSAINNLHKECLIIFGDFTVNNKNLSWYIKNKNNYEIKSGKIILISFESHNLEPNNTKISNVSLIKTIKGFLIKSNMYKSFLSKLKEKIMSWQSCLCQLIYENEFNCYQLDNQILD